MLGAQSVLSDIMNGLPCLIDNDDLTLSVAFAGKNLQAFIADPKNFDLAVWAQDQNKKLQDE